ncbi:hypothetical protein HAX54_003230 [Datura stramonium]|uniref:Uncharacterized protein n=1 Tax=Datura stramonium TaxID=4076 RepID=A0ABS8T521_DATST|nr:hypothetical protein [Datura stramonium]
MTTFWHAEAPGKEFPKNLRWVKGDEEFLRNRIAKTKSKHKTSSSYKGNYYYIKRQKYINSFKMSYNTSTIHKIKKWINSNLFQDKKMTPSVKNNSSTKRNSTSPVNPMLLSVSDFEIFSELMCVSDFEI